jgi:hypothetical protein
MNTRIVLRQRYGYLNEYKFHLLTLDDIRRIQEGDFYDELQSIPLDKIIFLIMGFQYCLDNSRNGFYFNGLGVNIWFDINRQCYYYGGNNDRFSMRYLCDLQHFLELKLNFVVNDFSGLSKYINDLYILERKLYQMNHN